MNRPAIRGALTQPKENPVVASEALEIWMPFRAVLSIVIDSVFNPQRREGLLVKGNGAIHVGDG